MTITIKLPFGCPKCEKREATNGETRYPDVTISFEQYETYSTPRGFVKHDFVCPGCGWGSGPEARKITAHTTQTYKQAETVFFQEALRREYYYLTDCTKCGTDWAFLKHDSEVEDYFDWHSQVPSRCRACGHPPPTGAVFVGRTVWVDCPNHLCGTRLEITLPAFEDYKEIQCERCRECFAVDSEGNQIQYFLLDDEGNFVGLAYTDLDQLAERKKHGPQVGVELELTVMETPYGLRLECFEPYSYGVSMDDFSMVSAHDRIRARVTSVNHLNATLTVEYIEIIEFGSGSANA